MRRNQELLTNQPYISVIIPMYNEEDNVCHVHEAVKKATRNLAYRFEYLFVNDGSSDKTTERLLELAQSDPQVVPIELARNFGKEIALTAGLHAAKGDAAIMLDADLQHPPDHIPEFIRKWEKGADVVVGVRKEYKTTWHKRLLSRLFYSSMNRISDINLTPHATDFRLVDKQVIQAFSQFTERNRITRGLFDWLGYKRDFVYFVADERQHGTASYSFPKLIRLGIDSFVGHSLLPLRLAGYLGSFITIISIPLGIFIFVNRYLFDNSLFGMVFSGNAILAIISLFLSGITLSCLGLMSLYIANIHQEVANRPLYVVRPNRRKIKRAAKELL
ncbi:glycosyltransferase family 2 protein [Candidatus Saccharibacteria bacterium]|nr:glycosyltransferase family 2 protein [Candidatus Saccharibacteria bacterium]